MTNYWRRRLKQCLIFSIYWLKNSQIHFFNDQQQFDKKFSSLFDFVLCLILANVLAILYNFWLLFLQGLYRGFTISCVGIFIYRGMYFGLYDSLKPILLGADASVLWSFLLGWGVTIFSGTYLTLLFNQNEPLKNGHFLFLISCEGCTNRAWPSRPILKNWNFLDQILLFEEVRQCHFITLFKTCLSLRPNG